MKENTNRKKPQIRKIQEDEPITNEAILFVDHSLRIAKQIHLALNGLNQKEFADLLGKKESEISKWLRGTHNFTLKTISKIEAILNKKIILCPMEIVPNEYRVMVLGDSKVLVKEAERGASHQSLSLFVDGGTYVTTAEECRTN